MSPRSIALYALCVALISGCHLPKNTPKLIHADDSDFIACGGFIWLSEEGGWGQTQFSVKFDDVDGLTHELHGLRKISFEDFPLRIPRPMPSYQGSTDGNGNPLVNGNVYTWDDGSTGIWTGKGWKAVMKDNDVCRAPERE